jgi:gliding motility-associated-like protein
LRWSYNPFSPNGDGIADITSLSFSLTEPKRISVKIFDRNGRLVRKLVDGYDLPANEHMSVSWDGKDEMGKTVEIGPYIYQIEGEGISLNGILVVVK